MEQMARLSRILLWKVLLSLSPGPASQFPNLFGSTSGVCGGTGGVLLPSPFFTCGIDALREPFGSSGSIRVLQSDEFRLTLPKHAEQPVSSPPYVERDALSSGAPSDSPGDPTAEPVAEANLGTQFPAEERQAEKVSLAELENGDITGLPSPPPTLDVDLEDEKGEKAEEQAWRQSKPVDVDQGPAQTSEPVAPQPPPLMPSPGSAAPSFPSTFEGEPQLASEGGVVTPPEAGIPPVVVVKHYFPEGIPVTIVSPR